jgi:hypothetical protein
VNGSGAAFGLGFATYTSYLPALPGTVNLSATKAGAGQPVVTTQTTLGNGQQYTAVLSHGLGNLQEKLYTDQQTPAAQGQIALRVIDAAEHPGVLKIFVAPGGNGAAPSLTVLSLVTGSASGYVTVPSTGTLTVTATVGEGVLDVPVATVPLKATSGAVRTIVFAGTLQAGAHGVVGFALDDVDAP